MTGILLAALVIELPLLGAPLSSELKEALNRVEGVERIEVTDQLLHLVIEEGKTVRYQQLRKTIRSRTSATELELDRIPLGPHTIFQIDAGQCFSCATAPLAKRLERLSWVDTWNIVGYAPKGRMRVRIEPKKPTSLEAIGMLPFEDILFTQQFDGVREVVHDWPTGGVEWRASEAEARAEARRLGKPLLLFPTGGT